MAVIDHVRGKIVNYDERRGVVVIEAPYTDFATMCRREYKEVEITLIDSRPLSAAQRKNCYAMIREISDWCGDTPESVKEALKLDFWRSELLEITNQLFSLSNAPMSVVAAFQKWLVRFIVRNDVPTRRAVLEYVDDVDDYVYACLVNKKCPICGKHADLHHIDAVGMGRDRTEIIHEGLEVLPLCREHHTEMHTIGKSAFFDKHHINNGIIADKTICRIYGLRKKGADGRKKRNARPDSSESEG